jgi:glycerophosphoryl diester phosphodiesterase
VPSLLVFAHRGGMAHAPQNTLAAFRRAVAAGAGGLETDAFVTRDGVVVLAHDAVVRRRPHRRTLIAELDRAELPPHVPTLDDLFDVAGPDLPVFIDVKDVAALPALAEVVRRRRDPADPRLWLAHAGYDTSQRRVVATWAATLPGVHLVDSTSVQRMAGDPGSYVTDLTDGPINWLNLPIREWTPELVELCRRTGVSTMAFRVHTARRGRRAVRLGLDAVHGNDVDALLRVAAARAPDTRAA